MAALCAMATSLKAQNTYPWPSSGNIGIGTSASSLATLAVKTTGTTLEFGTDANSSGILSYDRTNSLFKQIVIRGSSFHFFPFDVEKVTIDDNGNVGIGTTTPYAKLDVLGNVVFGNSTAARAIDASYDVNIIGSGSNKLRMIKANVVKVDFQINGNGSTDRLDLVDTDNGAGTPLTIKLDGTNKIGIGTTNPLSSLQVDDGCSKASIGDASGSDLNWGTSYLGFNASRSGSNWNLSNDSQHNGGGIIYSNILGEIYFAPIASNGTTDQTLSDTDIKNKITFRVSADGVTYAKKIKVELTNWPDYVFKPAYSLMPLTDVKSYIDKNHHLPDMPSAAEVEKDGLNVGEMNKLLAKKVEELTLYLIELKQENQEIKKTIQSLKSKKNKAINK